MKVVCEKPIYVKKSIDVEGVTLLSLDEFRMLPYKLRDIGKCWWLRTPGDNVGTVMYVDDFGEEHEEGETVDTVLNSFHMMHVRPVLLVSGVKKGEKIRIFDNDWTAFSENAVLCDTQVGAFRFDLARTDYESSDIKKWLEDWFQDQLMFMTISLRN